MDVKSNNGGGVPMRSGPSAHQELVLDNVQHQFAPDHVMSPMRVQVSCFVEVKKLIYFFNNVYF